MPKYRKTPVEIEAFLYDGNNAADVEEALGCTFNEGVIRRKDGKLPIKTLEGTILASPGDYIIKGVKGEIYPCKPDIFNITYELMSLTNPTPEDKAIEPPLTKEERALATCGDRPAWASHEMDVYQAYENMLYAEEQKTAELCSRIEALKSALRNIERLWIEDEPDETEYSEGYEAALAECKEVARASLNQEQESGK